MQMHTTVPADIDVYYMGKCEGFILIWSKNTWIETCNGTRRGQKQGLGRTVPTWKSTKSKRYKITDDDTEIKITKPQRCGLNMGLGILRIISRHCDETKLILMTVHARPRLNSDSESIHNEASRQQDDAKCHTGDMAAHDEAPQAGCVV